MAIEREEEESDSSEEESESDAEEGLNGNDYMEGGEDYQNEELSNERYILRRPHIQEIYFSTSGLSNAHKVKNAVKNAISALLRSTRNKKVGISCASHAFKMGFGPVAEGDWVQRPVLLTDLFQDLPQLKTKKGNPRKATANLAKFKDALQAARNKGVLKIFKDSTGREKVLVMIQNILQKDFQEASPPKNRGNQAQMHPDRNSNGQAGPSSKSQAAPHPPPAAPMNLPRPMYNVNAPFPHQNGNGAVHAAPSHAPVPMVSAAAAASPHPAANNINTNGQDEPVVAVISASAIDSLFDAQQAVSIMMEHKIMSVVCVPSGKKTLSFMPFIYQKCL